MEKISYSLRCAIVVDLIMKLRSRGSWCGETHIQKGIYILQDLLNANFGYKFVIYKHGPFSFELSNELSGMRASDIIGIVFPKEGYGPSIVATDFGKRVLDTHKENLEKFLPVSDFVANWFEKNDVKHLEKIATAYFVTKKYPREPAAVRAQRVHDLKPHVDLQSAEEAIKIVDRKRDEAKQRAAA